jgi:hypothetical protein
MVNEILTAAGVETSRARFLKQPGVSFAVYFDNIGVDAADRVTPSSKGLPRIITHDVSVELYEPIQDDAVEAAIEAELDVRGLSWTKQDRLWLDKEKLYQVVYEFNYITKKGD